MTLTFVRTRFTRIFLNEKMNKYNRLVGARLHELTVVTLDRLRRRNAIFLARRRRAKVRFDRTSNAKMRPKT